MSITKGKETLGERAAKCADGHWLFIGGTVIDHMMTGTRTVGIFPDGTIKIEYTDGTIEQRKGGEAILAQDADDFRFLSLVSWVQDGRTKERATA